MKKIFMFGMMVGLCFWMLACDSSTGSKEESTKTMALLSLASTPSIEEPVVIDPPVDPPLDSGITYPETGVNGKNVLYKSLTSVSRSKWVGESEEVAIYSLSVDIQEGKSFTVKVLSGSGSSIWIVERDPITNWISSNYVAGVTESFTVIEAGKISDMKFGFFQKEDYTFEYYENGDTTPTFTKTITVY
jgi:hypothetical protein